MSELHASQGNKGVQKDHEKLRPLPVDHRKNIQGIIVKESKIDEFTPLYDLSATCRDDKKWIFRGHADKGTYTYRVSTCDNRAAALGSVRDDYLLYTSIFPVTRLLLTYLTNAGSHDETPNRHSGQRQVVRGCRSGPGFRRRWPPLKEELMIHGLMNGVG